MPYTYMVQCTDGSFYTGWTVDLEVRIRTHNSGRGGNYTRSRRPVKLVYWEFQPNRSEAQKREAALRKLKREGKKTLVENFRGEL